MTQSKADNLFEIETLRTKQLLDLSARKLNLFCKLIEIPGAPFEGNDKKEALPFFIKPARHHEIINSALNDIGDGKLKRLMIFMPPGSAKSTYASVAFPVWFMGRKAGANIICVSYGSDLARKFGRRCRQIAGSKRFKEIFDTTLVDDNRAVDSWAMKNGSTYMAGGVLSGITGNRADGLIIDDPLKGKEEAESKIIRDKIWEAYLSDLRTRLKPNGWIVIIQTRWHSDDLSGRILPSTYAGESGEVVAKDGEAWKVISLQAQCTRHDDPLGRNEGEYLWTEWFSQSYWEQEKKTQGGRNWAALYQQSPRLEDGGVFSGEWFRYFKTAPFDYVRVVQSWDTAQKEGELNDFSACTTWIQTRLGYYLIDVFKERMNYPKLKRAVISKAAEFSPRAILIEDKGSGISLIQDLANETDLPIITIEPVGDKIFRAASVSPMYEAGRVHHKEDAHWLIDYETELTTFPATAHDDQTDSTTQALSWMGVQDTKFEMITSGNKRNNYTQD